ncbi:MAG TPA: hypothetical protein PLH70_00480 [Bacteroidales bacterium]|nr:hypothetical protein [Bacteroidales bacterium]HOH21719.1 hypothetical protein [Bacteroidales bacterium]HPB57422.1 hypothetical protein [Bacteroidales bacterium]HPZ02858.1 hypothetical protein [Bacteroidales bacterium]HQB74260.1 hypothetical protein [Bacteroidales bacterium]
MGLIKKTTLFVLFFSFSIILYSQGGWTCDSAAHFLDKIEKKIAHFQPEDPELITLHYLFALDNKKELEQFYTEIIPSLSHCDRSYYYQLIEKYDQLSKVNSIFLDSLSRQKDRVDELFYRMGYHEFKLKNFEYALYHVDRSLEYNPLNGDPLLIKLEILFHNERYKECLDILNVLYYDIEINEEQEKKIIDFNARFYDQVYHLGDSLVIEDRATEAFRLFGILETFCHIMPSGYCNDDYYHGILRSKSGVYESYLKIASVARERKNYEMEKRFLQYAQEYLDENPEIADQGKQPKSELLSYSTPAPQPILKKPTPSTEITVSAVDPPIKTLPNPVVEDRPAQSKPNSHTAAPKAPTIREGDKKEETATVSAAPQIFLNQKEEKKENLKIENANSDTPQTPAQEPVDPMKEYKKYQDLIMDGLVSCIKEEFEEAYQQFSAAKKLESCNCFEQDARVDLFLKELEKLDIKK